MKTKKIFENLIIEPPSWKSLLIAPAFLMVGLSLILEGFESDSLVCSRTAQAPHTCELFHSTLFETTSVKQFPLSQLKEARIDKSPNSRMMSCILVTEQGVLQLGSISSGYEVQKQEIVSKINRFLQNPNQVNLSVKESLEFSMIFYGIVFILVALFLLFHVIYFCFYLIYFLLKLLLFRNQKK